MCGAFSSGAVCQCLVFRHNNEIVEKVSQKSSDGQSRYSAFGSPNVRPHGEGGIVVPCFKRFLDVLATDACLRFMAPHEELLCIMPLSATWNAQQCHEDCVIEIRAVRTHSQR